MERMTKDDVKQMGMVDLAHNQVFIKDGEAWFRDFEREISVIDLAKEMLTCHGVQNLTDMNMDDFSEYMLYLLELGNEFENVEVIIGLLYRALWSMADVREQLKAYEDTGFKPEEIKGLGKWIDELRKELKEYRNLEEQGRLIKLPCKVGDKVYIVHHPAKSRATMEFIPFKIGLYDWLGKTVFLTQEEAEVALKGVER